MEVHQAGPQNEGTNGFLVSLLLPGKDLSNHGYRVRRGVSDDPSQRRGDFDRTISAVSFRVVVVFPFVKLNLCGDGLNRNLQLRPEIEGPQRHTAIEVTEFGQRAIR